MPDYSRGPREANFDLFTMEISISEAEFEGGNIQRITHHEKADVSAGLQSRRIETNVDQHQNARRNESALDRRLEAFAGAVGMIRWT